MSRCEGTAVRGTAKRGTANRGTAKRGTANRGVTALAALGALALTAALLAGCGGLVPAEWLAADAEYIEALPDEARTRVGAPLPVAARAAGDPAISMAVMEPVVATLNELTLQSVRVIENIVAAPPDHYEEHRRVWGPAYSTDFDVTYELSVERADEQLFDYALLGQLGDVDTPDVEVMTGRYARDGEGTGRGRFTLDLGAVSEVFEVDLGFRDNVEVVHQIDDGLFAVGMDLQGLTVSDSGASVVLSEQYAYRDDGAGGLLCFAGRHDVDGGGSDEEVHAFAAWIDGIGGRAEGTLAGGDLGSDSTEFVECWDAAGTTTYWFDTLGLLIESGDIDLCSDTLPETPDSCADVYPQLPG